MAAARCNEDRPMKKRIKKTRQKKKNIKPVWKDNEGILLYDGEVILHLNKPAPNQRAILNAFERAGWPTWIPNPLEPDPLIDERQRLADAVYRLNRNVADRPLHFRRDGRGHGVCLAG